MKSFIIVMSRTPDYTLYSGVHVCWSEHSDSSFVYGFMSLDYGLGTMTATTLYSPIAGMCIQFVRMSSTRQNIDYPCSGRKRVSTMKQNLASNSIHTFRKMS